MFGNWFQVLLNLNLLSFIVIPVSRFRMKSVEMFRQIILLVRRLPLLPGVLELEEHHLEPWRHRDASVYQCFFFIYPS